MPIEIDIEACTGCGKCARACPGNLLSSGGGEKAAHLHPQRCWGCAACVKECPCEAISLYLEEGLGGKGGRMTAKRDGRLLVWTVRMPDGSVKRVALDASDASKY
jgi:adenylylsulfate reductase subunit B